MSKIENARVVQIRAGRLCIGPRGRALLFFLISTKNLTIIQFLTHVSCKVNDEIKFVKLTNIPFKTQIMILVFQTLTSVLMIKSQTWKS